MEERQAIRERLEAFGARFLWVVYHDYAGLARAKAVTRDRLDEALASGVTFAMANWDLAITDHQVPHPIFGADSGDFRAVPDPAALVPIPWRPGVAQAYSRLTDDLGRPWEGDPRGRLGAQVEMVAARGLRCRMAFEAEFTLAVAEEAAAGPGGDADGPVRLPSGWRTADRGRMFIVDEIEARWEWCARALDALAGMGIAVHQFAKEYGPAQYELSLLPADPLAAVDRFLLARQAIKALARDAGLVATFMPKPFARLPGNGLHVHMSFADADDRDVVVDPADERALSPTGGAILAGLLAHAAGQAALGSPTPNSYKRLLPGSWAPAHVAWALGNRAALVRIPGRGAARHLEYRSGDASANAYLLVTGLLAAVDDGLARGLPPPPAVAADIGLWSDEEAATRGVARLPSRLDAALDALERDEVLLTALGPVIPEHYLAVKRFELDSYLAESGADPDATEVTDWERAAYLEPV